MRRFAVVALLVAADQVVAVPAIATVARLVVIDLLQFGCAARWRVLNPGLQTGLALQYSFVIHHESDLVAERSESRELHQRTVYAWLEEKRNPMERAQSGHLLSLPNNPLFKKLLKSYTRRASQNVVRWRVRESEALRERSRRTRSKV